MDNAIPRSYAFFAKSRDIIKTTAARGSRPTNHALPEAENHTGQDQK
jgi:hypothetical protein